MNKLTLVIGASENPSRYSNMAVKRLTESKNDVKAIGRRSGEIRNIKIETGKPAFTDIHTVTLYLNQTNQAEYEDYIISLKPKRVIFNPGAENPSFEKKLTENNIEVEEACTLVMLSTHQY